MSNRLINDNWIKAYLKYTDVNESPELFHLWVGASVISAALDRNVYSSLLFNEYPNLYVILVAGSQKCHKSFAIELGTDLLEKIDKDFYVMSQKMTPEAMISGLQESAEINAEENGEEKATGVIVADEIATYLNQNSIQRGMLPVLLKLHDCVDPFEYKTKSRGTEYLPKTYATFLAGSAPEYLRTSLPTDEAGGGMLARTILVYQDNPRKPRPFLELDEAHDELEDKLIRDLNRISRLEGDMELSEAAHDWYEEWYVEQWHTGKDTFNKHKSLKHYHAKKPGHLATLGIIMSVAEDDRLVIEKRHFSKALRVLNVTEQTMHKPLRNIMTEGRGLITKTIRDAIATIWSYNERPTYKRILRTVHETVDYEEMQRAVETLEKAGLVELRQTDDEMYYIPNENLQDERELEGIEDYDF